jgi:hypothetical protein
MNAKNILNDARKAEREENDEKAEELYRAIIDSFPDSKYANEARLDLDDLLGRKETLSQLSMSQPIEEKTQTVKTTTIKRVAVVDINIPFWSMVTFMVKGSIAAIPAFIILTIIIAGIFAIFGIINIPFSQNHF